MRLMPLLVLGLLSACGGNPTDDAAAAEMRGGVDGEAAYTAYCAGCHDTGVTFSGISSAPILGDAASWQGRSERSRAQLMEHAREGFRDMPGRAGQPDLSDETVNAAVEYMLGVTFPDRPPEQ